MLWVVTRLPYEDSVSFIWVNIHLAKSGTEPSSPFLPKCQGMQEGERGLTTKDLLVIQALTEKPDAHSFYHHILQQVLSRPGCRLKNATPKKQAMGWFRWKERKKEKQPESLGRKEKATLTAGWGVEERGTVLVVIVGRAAVPLKSDEELCSVTPGNFDPTYTKYKLWQLC